MRKIRENLHIKKELIGTGIAGIMYLVSFPVLSSAIKDFELLNFINRKLPEIVTNIKGILYAAFIFLIFTLATMMPTWLSRKSKDNEVNLSDMNTSDTERVSKSDSLDLATVLRDGELLAQFRSFLTEEFSLENLIVR